MAEGSMTGEEMEMSCDKGQIAGEMSRVRMILFAIASALAAMTLIATVEAEPVEAAGITSFSMSPSTTQAGGHPDLDVHMRLETRGDLIGGCYCEDVETTTVSSPAGVIGIPHALPRCTLLQFGQHRCPTESQVGIASVSVLFNAQQAMFNMEPHPDQAGLIGFELPLINTPSFIDLNARTESDFGLVSASVGIPHLIGLEGVDLHIWGVPGSAIHDPNRVPSPQTESICTTPYPQPCGASVPFNGPVEPFLQNPTTCGIPLTAGLYARYYNLEEFHAEAPWPATTGCDQLSFNPSLTAHPTTTQADTPTGVDIALVVPQTQSPTTPTPSQIRTVTVTMPEGFSVNPNAADGKQACTDLQASFGTRNAAQCPEHSKVGTLSLDSSALPAPIDGAIYLGEPIPGNRYRLFLTADGFATHVKLAGSVHLDPQTGQVVVEFKDLPQSPLTEFNMHFFGAERALLATPSHCGKYEVHSEFVPWDSVLPNQTSTSFFAIASGPSGSPCPTSNRPFNPSLRAGMADNTAAVHSTFALKVYRADGDQQLAALSITTPPGFLAKLRGIPYCPEAALATVGSLGYAGLSEQTSPACPQASQVGTVMADAGAGSRPLHVPGKVYLAGPYKGAPLSLSVIVPALSGPYDLGTVAVRAAIQVNPITAQVSTLSDPVPQILDGVPLRLRSIILNLDRPDFALNPTNCDPFAVQTQIFGDQGAVATPAAHFQVANCAGLPYDPKLSLKLTGGVKRRGHPAIHAVFEAKRGEANTSRVSVTLPKGELLDNSHIGTVCKKCCSPRDNARQPHSSVTPRSPRRSLTSR